MERAPFGRDLGLSFRMAVCLTLLVVLYLPFFAWVVGIAYFVWGVKGAFLATCAAAAFLAAAPYLSERLALAWLRAETGTDADALRLGPMLERLCGLADMPVPRLAVVRNEVPNAFSAGRSPKSAVIVVTSGLLERLDDGELEAVLAHELAHIANRDAFVMTIAAAPAMVGRKALWGFASLPFTASSPGGKVGGAIAVLYLLPLLFVGWIVYAFATLLVMSITRYREFVADRGAALITGEPEQLMSALQKIADAFPLIPDRDLRSVATLNAFFILPADGLSEGLEVDPLRIFPTHPPLAKRLERLGKLARELGRARGLPPAEPVPVDVPLAPKPDNPQALGAFFLAVLVWGMLGGLLLTGPEFGEGLLWVPLLGSLALAGGVFLGFQGVGRASAGAEGMTYAVVGLVLLLGPWVLAVLFVVAVAIFGLFGGGPPI